MIVYCSLLYAGLFSALLIAVAAALMGLFHQRRNMAGQHVVITGGSKGIGLALAQQFLKRKCQVTLLARQQTDLDRAVKLLEEKAAAQEQDSKVQAFSADATSPDQVSPDQSMRLKLDPCRFTDSLQCLPLR